MRYPSPARGDAADTFHGHTVGDPYRSLEDPDGEATVQWVTQQQAVLADWLAQANGTAVRAAVRAALEKRFNYSRVGSPIVAGPRVFFYKNDGLQNQDVLLCAGEGAGAGGEGLTDAALIAGARTFVDLNAQFPDGTVALSSTSFSEDGSHYAYGLSRGGSDWVTLHVRDVASGADLPDTVPWVKFSSIQWLHSGEGFFYCRYPEAAGVADGAEGGKAGTETGANTCALVCYHALGTDAAEDVLVYANPSQPNWRYGIEVSDDGEYLLLSTVKGTDPVNRLYYAHLPSVWAGWKDREARKCAVLPGGTPPPQPTGTTASAAEGAYLPFVRAFDTFDGELSYVTNDGPRFYLKTNLDAPRYRIVAADFPADASADGFVCAGAGAPAPGATVDINAPRGPMSAVHDVVAQHPTDVLDWAAVSGRHLIVCVLRDVCHALSVRLLPSVPPTLPAVPGAAPSLLLTAESDVPLPAPGTVAGWSGRRDIDTAWLKFTSFLHPGSILQLDFKGPGAEGARMRHVEGPRTATLVAGTPTPVPSPDGSAAGPCATIRPYWNALVPGFDASRFVVDRAFVPSTDGKVKIPLFIVRRAGAGGSSPLPLLPAPTILYSYGGFSISLQPNYSSVRLGWLEECGGVWALACVRGGGEYGEEWHEGGAKRHKINCFDDLTACGAYLVEKGYTTPRSLGLMGGSNGGLGVLATALRSPASFGAIVSQVPVTDMLRFHKFTIGSAWRGEYGFAEEEEGDFAYMRSYSPLHNVVAPTSAATQLPSILITTADHDDRVVPLHSHKMTATLQHVAGGSAHQTRPLLTRVDVKAGHGAGKPTGKVLDEYADVYTFLSRELGGRVELGDEEEGWGREGAALPAMPPPPMTTLSGSASRLTTSTTKIEGVGALTVIVQDMGRSLLVWVSTAPEGAGAMGTVVSGTPSSTGSALGVSSPLSSGGEAVEGVEAFAGRLGARVGKLVLLSWDVTQAHMEIAGVEVQRSVLAAVGQA
jgi:prolyl oligopeptidase